MCFERQEFVRYLKMSCVYLKQYAWMNFLMRWQYDVRKWFNGAWNLIILVEEFHLFLIFQIWLIRQNWNFELENVTTALQRNEIPLVAFGVLKIEEVVGVKKRRGHEEMGEWGT